MLARIALVIGEFREGKTLKFNNPNSFAYDAKVRHVKSSCEKAAGKFLN
jgi:hypothetical protein